MKRIAALFAVLLIGSTAIPAAAEAQARGCVPGPNGKGCRGAQQGGDSREDRGDRGGRGGSRDDRGGGDMGTARARPPGRGDEGGPSERTRPPGRGGYAGSGNSLGDGWNPREEDARDGVRGGRLVPLEQVIRNIARSTPGQLLDAGLENRGDRPIYRVRWQTNDGRRIDYIVDARTGQIIGRN